MDGDGLNLLIVELVLQAMDPEHLPACRLVNHAWNSIATRLLDRAGWTIHLDLDEIFKYIDVVNAVGVPKRIVSLGVTLHAASYMEWTALHSHTILRAIAAIETTFQSQVKRLFITVGRDGNFHPSLTQLIRANVAILRPRKSMIGEEAGGSSRVLPALKSLSITNSDFYHYQTPALRNFVRTFTLRATNLEVLRLEPWYGQSDELSVLSEIHAIDARVLGNLLELDVEDFSQVSDVHSPKEILFNRLLTLRTGKWKSTIPDLIRHFCPGLRKIEIKYWDETEVNQNTHDVLPNIIQLIFGGNLRRPAYGICGNGWLYEKTQEKLFTEAFLRTMASFPNLTSAELKLENLIAIYNRFRQFDDRLRAWKWLNLKRLSLNMVHQERYLIKASNICWVINEMFPNLETICLQLDGKEYRASQTRTNVNLRYAFGFISGLFWRVKHAEIVTDYDNWNFGRPCACVQDETEDELTAEAVTASLETITIRISKKSGEVQPSPLNLSELLELISNYPNILFRLDSRLPLSATGHSFEHVLLPEMEGRSNPRVIIF